jgi:hypothetical protein
MLVTKKFDDGSQFTNAKKEVKNIYPSLSEPK